MNNKRVCTRRSFGLEEGVHTCSCSEEEVSKCIQEYPTIKKSQYVDSKGQHLFNEKRERN